MDKVLDVYSSRWNRQIPLKAYISKTGRKEIENLNSPILLKESSVSLSFKTISTKKTPSPEASLVNSVTSKDAYTDAFNK